MEFNHFFPSYEDVAVMVTELVFFLIIFISINIAIGFIFKKFESISFLKRIDVGKRKVVEHKLKALSLLICVICAIISFSFNAFLVYQQIDVLDHSINLIKTIPPNFWQQFGFGLIKIMGLFLAAKFLLPKINLLLLALQKRAINYEQIKANNESIEAFFLSLKKILKPSVWLLVLAISCKLLSLPAAFPEFIIVVLKIYLIVSLGYLIITAVSVVVGSVDELAKRYTQSTNLEELYARMRKLLPILRRTMEYIIYVTTATLATSQVSFIARFAEYGPILIQIIGIIFLSRVFIEIGNLLVDKFVLKLDTDLSEIERQKRITLAPLSKSFCKYVSYFIAFLLILRTLDFSIAPILAAIGGVGLILGLAAQPVITDLVSGACILLENLYLVGDYIETENASGIVETIDIRTTRLRDPDGQLYIVRNGQINSLVNFSKGYIHAVVEVGVSYGSDLNQVYRVIQETGDKLRESNVDVLEVTQVEGIAKFDESSLVIHTITKSKPGRHREVGFEFRKMLIEAFGREGIEIPFAHRVLTFKKEDREILHRSVSTQAT